MRIVSIISAATLILTSEAKKTKPTECFKSKVSSIKDTLGINGKNNLCDYFNSKPRKEYIPLSDLNINSGSVCGSPPEFTFIKNSCECEAGFFLSGYLTYSSLVNIRLSSKPELNNKFVDLIVSPNFTAVHLPHLKSSRLKFSKKHDIKYYKGNSFSDIPEYKKSYALPLLKSKKLQKKLGESDENSNLFIEIDNESLFSGDTAEIYQNSGNIHLRKLPYYGDSRDNDNKKSKFSKSENKGQTLKNVMDSSQFLNKSFPETLGYEHLNVPISGPPLKIYKKTTILEKKENNDGNKKEYATPFFVHIDGQKLIFGSGIPGATDIYPLIGLKFEKKVDVDAVISDIKNHSDFSSRKDPIDVLSYEKRLYSQILPSNYFGFWSYDKGVKLTEASLICGYSNQFKNFNNFFDIKNALVESADTKLSSRNSKSRNSKTFLNEISHNSSTPNKNRSKKVKYDKDGDEIDTEIDSIVEDAVLSEKNSDLLANGNDTNAKNGLNDEIDLEIDDKDDLNNLNKPENFHEEIV
ncbi:hypothetical protein AYI70_g4784 [Smittium culicis]|uniref:Uncharacterized protein n=1 Tax=Smittium culicis TaxID=133412 RepID=A0A1R1XXN0_9FUNG|nr:hypothetical protein AYI70_g4784 [Smittium culicis]